MRPHTLNLSDKQWYNFICGLISGRYLRNARLKAEMNGKAADMNTNNLQAEYQIVFVTNEDGDIATPASVSCFLISRSPDTIFELQQTKIEIALTNPSYQPVFEIHSDDSQELQDFVLNHCPIVTEAAMNASVPLTVLQQYRPALVITDDNGLVSYTHEHNLVLSVSEDITLNPGEIKHLFDLQMTWKQSETLVLSNPTESVSVNYYAGDVNVEDGINTTAYINSQLVHIPVNPAALTFGNPKVYQNQQQIKELAARQASLSVSASTTCMTQQKTKYEGGYIEYSYELSPSHYQQQDPQMSIQASTGLGGTWRTPAPTSTVYYGRHRVYPINTGTYDISVIIVNPNGEDITEETPTEIEVVPNPIAPRIATARSQYTSEKLQLADDIDIAITRPSSPEVYDKLVLNDNLIVHIKRDQEHVITHRLTLTDLPAIQLTSTQHKIQQKLQITDEVKVNQYTPPVPVGDEQLQLTDNVQINI